MCALSARQTLAAHQKMNSNLGFAAGSFKAGRRPVTSNRLFRGPPNPKMEAFYEQARRQREEALAAQKMAAPPPGVPQQPRAAAPKAATPGAPRQAPVGGIEAQIAEARAMAETAQHQIAAVKNGIEERVAGAELHVVGATATLRELTGRLKDLEVAARDAWMASFWMYGDVVVRSAQFSKPPPAGTVAFVEPGATVLLVGEMVDTAAGPAMAARAVDAAGQISMVWMLLRDDRGRELISNFRLAA
jgi:hypothetical protein